jgi:SAM-dependent methyltransferase
VTSVTPGDACPACDSPEIRTVCRGSDRLFGTTTDTFFVVECAGCKLQRLYPRPAPADLPRYYPASYWYDPGASAADRYAEIWRRFVLRDHVAFVRKTLSSAPPEGLVLDVGCGGGLFLHELGLPASTVAGLDFSLHAATVAWSVNGVPALCGSLARAPLPAACCRAITMFHVLEHLYDPASYLYAARDLLMKDGRLVVQVPNASCWQFLLFGERWNGIDIPRHLFDFRLDDLRLLLESCGFELLRVKHFSLRDNPAGLASTLAPSLDPMGRRVRGLAESPRLKLAKDLAYGALVLASLPFAALEAACRAGSTVMIEARPKP